MNFWIFFFNWNSLHPRLSSHSEAWNYKKNKHKKVKSYRKFFLERTYSLVKRCLLILDLKPHRSFNCRFFLNRFPVYLNSFVFLFLVTSCLVVAVQPCIKKDHRSKETIYLALLYLKQSYPTQNNLFRITLPYLQ